MSDLSDDQLREQLTQAESVIESIYPQMGTTPDVLSHPENTAAIHLTLSALDRGIIRVAQQDTDSGIWKVNAWIKKAILLYFRISRMTEISAGDLRFWDKVPLKTSHQESGVRVVPPALARFGSFIEPGAILMPSYVNIGAYVGSGTMVDTWATVGSCAQIGRNVHLSGGVGIGGVLEPPQANPVIIEDNAFLGSRCVVVEGVHIQEGAVLGSGVILTASTKIIDVSGPEPVTHKGFVPRNSVVIPGSIPREFPAGIFHIPAALIIGLRKESTDTKTSLNDALREFEVSV